MPTPLRAVSVVVAGVIINLCLGILYAWSVWKKTLIAGPGVEPGTAMGGLNAGWQYLTATQGTLAYSVCGFLFAITMIFAGRWQDRYGPRLCVSASGLFLGAGCIIAGLLKSFEGLVLGFGILGGIGMGLGYASATPVAVKWFGPHRRGLVVGLVVGGFGAAAIYIAPLAEALITQYGLTGSFVGLGLLFGTVIVLAAQVLKRPPAGYVPPGGPPRVNASAVLDVPTRQMLKTKEYYALLFMMFGSAQTGLVIIANASAMLKETAASVAFFAANAWLLASYGGAVNALGRVGTGSYSDRLGRGLAYRLNGLLAIAALLAIPTIMAQGGVVLLFIAVGLVYWQYGGGLALLPATTADLFGSKHLGLNYGCVFLGWGLAFFVALAADRMAKGDAFLLSAAILAAAVLVSLLIKTPKSR
jgi:MFS transporter, OFA family, oxalate/formate antiporter